MLFICRAMIVAFSMLLPAVSAAQEQNAAELPPLITDAIHRYMRIIKPGQIVILKSEKDYEPLGIGAAEARLRLKSVSACVSAEPNLSSESKIYVTATLINPEWRALQEAYFRPDLSDEAVAIFASNLRHEFDHLVRKGEVDALTKQIAWLEARRAEGILRSAFASEFIRIKKEQLSKVREELQSTRTHPSQ